jgi:hypothetical protein
LIVAAWSKIVTRVERWARTAEAAGGVAPEVQAPARGSGLPDRDARSHAWLSHKPPVSSFRPFAGSRWAMPQNFLADDRDQPLLLLPTASTTRMETRGQPPGVVPPRTASSPTRTRNETAIQLVSGCS